MQPRKAGAGVQRGRPWVSALERVFGGGGTELRTAVIYHQPSGAICLLTPGRYGLSKKLKRKENHHNGVSATGVAWSGVDDAAS